MYCNGRYQGKGLPGGHEDIADLADGFSGAVNYSSAKNLCQKLHVLSPPLRGNVMRQRHGKDVRRPYAQADRKRSIVRVIPGIDENLWMGNVKVVETWRGEGIMLLL
jgi:hypothetical protein